MKYYIIDAFANEILKGNPAGVCVLEKPMDTKQMQLIAAENNLSETAFILKKETTYVLRWFTPTFEINLCGHATLASSFVICNFIDKGAVHIKFQTISGEIEVTRNENLYEMLLPCQPIKKVTLTTQQLAAAGCSPIDIFAGRDLYLVLNSESEVQKYVPNYSALQSLSQWLGIVITAKGTHTDFISRYFCPELNCEDPVTGSSHCSLIPYWSQILNQKQLTAKQLSSRGGIIYCKALQHKVKIAGTAVLFMQGEIQI